MTVIIVRGRDNVLFAKSVLENKMILIARIVINQIKTGIRVFMLMKHRVVNYVQVGKMYLKSSLNNMVGYKIYL